MCHLDCDVDFYFILCAILVGIFKKLSYENSVVYYKNLVEFMQ